MTESINDKKKEQSNIKEEIFSFAKTVIIFIALWFTIRSTFIEAFKIPSGSMIPTLQIGDFLLVNKLSYGLRLPFFDETVWQYDAPKRGDVVVFTKDVLDPTDEKGMNFIKRVIAVGGDKVSVKGTTVYLNGKALDEPYAKWRDGGKIDGEMEEITIPEGHVFLLGDNRDRSLDSRYWKRKTLPISRIKGRALFIYFSFYDLKRIFNIIK